MQFKEQVEGIIRARSLAAQTLLSALGHAGSACSERKLADLWIRAIREESNILPFGWYQPPPNGMSVMVARGDSYERLNFMSLREEVNWPSDNIQYTEEAILYPYFSAIDRATLMIGDFVGTFYAGHEQLIRDWLREAYGTTKRIANSITFGMSFSEIFSIANNEMLALGARNNTFSLSGGLASDIGHTVPFCGDETIDGRIQEMREMDAATLSRRIADQREFVSGKSLFAIDRPCAFTIEPQFVTDGLPMASFHMIIAISESDKFIVEKFQEVFEYFGMDSWIGAKQ